MSLLEVKHLKKVYTTRFGGAKVEALADVEFSVEEGEYVAIMGESGSGKTTLLNILAALDKPTGGKVLLNGRDMAAVPDSRMAAYRRDNLGFVFQEYNLLDTLTLEENTALPLTIQGLGPEEIGPRVRKIADKLQIGDVLGKFPFQTSGGQKQRCAFARAVVCGPKIIFADEPTGALDSNSARVLLEIISQLHEDLETTVFMVTHDAFCASYAERILFLKDGKIFNELVKGEKTRGVFYHEILDVLSLLGGDGQC